MDIIMSLKKEKAGLEIFWFVIIRIASLRIHLDLKSSCRAMLGAIVQVAHEQITFAKKPVIRLMWSAVMRSQKA